MLKYSLVVMFMGVASAAHASSTVCLIKDATKLVDDFETYYVDMINQNCSSGDVLELPGLRVIYSASLIARVCDFSKQILVASDISVCSYGGVRRVKTYSPS